MNQDDPVAALQAMAREVTQRTPPRFQTDAELWRLVALLEVVLRDHREYVDAFPPDVRELFSAAARAPLAAFSAPRAH